MPLTRFVRPIVDRGGNVIPGAIATIMKDAGGAAVLYSDAAGLSPLPSNTVATNADGEIAFYTTPGLYDITATYGGRSILDEADVPIIAPSSVVEADHYPSLSAALTAVYLRGGGGVWLTPGKRYTLAEQLQNNLSYCGFFSDGTAELYGPASVFNNTAIGTRYTNNAALVNMSGQTTAPFTSVRHNFLRGVRVTSEVADGRVVDGIVARNVEHIDISRCEVSGLPLGCGIKAASLTAGKINDNYVHDIYTNLVWSGGTPQLTGIELDQDRVNGVNSYGTQVRTNRVMRVHAGDTFLTAHGPQTDGINIAHYTTTMIDVSANLIDTVGEGIDVFGAHCTLDANRIIRARYAAYKFTHGAKFNRGAGGVIFKFGRYGIVMAGSAVPGVGDTTRNGFTGLTITEGDYLNLLGAANTACIGFEDNGGVDLDQLPRTNSFSACVLSQGDYCQNGWYDESNGSGNYGSDMVIEAGAANVKRVRVDNAGGSCQLVGASTYYTDLT